jgi:hypothetical protein
MLLLQLLAGLLLVLGPFFSFRDHDNGFAYVDGSDDSPVYSGIMYVTTIIVRREHGATCRSARQPALPRIPGESIPRLRASRIQ